MTIRYGVSHVAFSESLGRREAVKGNVIREEVEAGISILRLANVK